MIGTLQQLIEGPPADECIVCGKRACHHIPIAGHPIDEHPPIDHSQDHTTAVELGHPFGIRVLLDGVTVQDGSRDGFLLYGPTDLIPLQEARRLGLIPPALMDAAPKEPGARADGPTPESRAVHGPVEDRAVHGPRRCRDCGADISKRHPRAVLCVDCASKSAA
jgi:hypothetical protein